MPIFEFKCSKCEEFFEVIVMGSDDDTVNCPKCKSNQFQRVVSKTNYAMGSSSSSRRSQEGVQTQERQCSSGSCTTYTVPGETKD